MTEPRDFLFETIDPARFANGDKAYRDHCPDCGKEAIRPKRRLGKPCHPCAQKRRATHGLSRDPIYWLLQQMKARCYIPSASNYAYYGGRGIRVCDEWLEDPAAFVAWAKENGWRRGLEINRINGDGDYAPGNCEFVTHRINSRSRRRDRLNPELVAQARSLLAVGMSVNEVRKELAVPYMTIWHLNNGSSWGEVA